MTTIEFIEKEFNKLEALYDSKFTEVEKEIDLGGTSLRNALKSQLRLQMEWEILSKRVNKIYDLCENFMEESYNTAMSEELRNSHRINTITEAKEFAKTNKDYRLAKRMLLEIREVRDEVRAVVDVLTSRKYILNNMTNAIIGSVEDTIL